MRHSVFSRISIFTGASIMLAGARSPASAASPSPAETQQLRREAASACRRGEFYEFLEAFASAAVRARYRGMPSEPFQIGKVDYAYVDPASVALSNPDPTKRFRELAVNVTDLPDKGRRLTYQPGIFRDDGEGDGQTLVRRTGKPRSYEFAWKTGCWRLSKASN